MRPVWRLSVVVLVVVCALIATSAALADGITNSGDDLRTGWYPNAEISPQVVSGGTFGQLWSTPVNGQVYAQPLVATTTGGGQTNETVIVATETDHVYGLDPANHGAPRWSTTLTGTPFNPADLNCPDINPSIGTTATPVIDPATNTVYLTHKAYASGSSGPAVWYLDALDANTGLERSGYPVTISGPADNAPSMQFNPTHEQQRPGLLLMNGVVYLGFGGHCDSWPWEGWIIGVNVATRQTTARWVDNPGPNQNGAGIWQSGVGLMSDGPGTLLFMTGNGGSPTTPAPGTSPPQNFGESVVRLDVQAGGALTAVDFFAPFDADSLDSWDADFGSGGIVGLPGPYFGSPSVPHLAVAVGKEGFVYLLNRDALGGYQQGAGGGDQVVQRLGAFGGVWGRPGVWPGDGGYVYIPTVTGVSGGGMFDVYKYGVTGNGTPALSTAGNAPDVFGWGSGSPVITSDGTRSGSALVWVIWSTGRTGANAQLRAYNPIPVNGTLQQVYTAPIGTAANYSMPGVGNDGRLYVGTRDGHVLAFGSPVAQPVSGQSPTFPTTTVGSSSSPQTLTLTAHEPVTVANITSSSSFAVDTSAAGLPVQLSTGQTLSVPVTFSPSQPGLAAGQITVTTDSGPVAIPVSATGQAASAHLIANLPLVSLGGTTVGGHLSSTVTFSNDGNAAVTIDTEQLPGAPFSVSGAPAVGNSIAPGQSVTVEVDFAPTQIGQFSNEIDLHTADGEDVQVGVAGSASTPGVLTFSTQNVDFGAVTVGTTATRTFTLTNTGGSNVTINKSKPPFAGAIVAALGSLPEGATVAPGQTLTETVSFTPQTTGPAATSWAITGDDGSGLHEIQFTGTGVAVGGTATSTGGGTPPRTGPRGGPVVPAHPVPAAPKVAPAVATTATLGHIVITYTALVAATSHFTIQREAAGYRAADACVALTARDRRAGRCTRFVTVSAFTHRDRAGVTRLRLTSMVRATRLTPGTYRVRSVLYDARGRGHVFVTTLRIKPAGRK